jgi:tetratricopeptide (TPR) repeat protein
VKNDGVVAVQGRPSTATKKIRRERLHTNMIDIMFVSAGGRPGAKRRAPNLLLFTTLFLFCFTTISPLVFADIIQLKNGNAIEAKILKEDEKFVVVEAPGGKIKIPKSDIKMVWRGSKEELVEVRGKAVYFAKGVEMYKSGRFKEAAESFEQSLGSDAVNAVIYANLGSAYASAGEAQKAEESFLKALEGEPKKPEVLLNLANLYLTVKNFSRAVEVFQEYLKLNPDDEIAKSGMANGYYALGQYQKAYDLYRSLKRANETPFLNNQAAALIQLRRFEEAKRILDPLTSGPVVFSKPFLNLAELYRLTGNYDESKRYYGIVLKKEPQNADAQIGMAKVFLKENNLREAEEYLGRISESDPGNKNVRHVRAQLLAEQGEFAKASAIYEEILERDPRDWVAGNNLGLLYIKMEEPRKALDAFERVLAFNELYARGHANKGLAHAFLNDADKALKEWNRALEIDPNLREAVQNKKILEEAIRGEKVR